MIFSCLECRKVIILYYCSLLGDSYYINMNKKRQINVNLNTINIPYTMKLNSDRIQKSIISSPPGRI